ncbi:hypothetical protein EDB85DRAFT_1848192, partial [Lactarius pseudohatsudake]
QYLKQRTQVDIRIGANAAIYTSAVLEYLTAEVAGASRTTLDHLAATIYIAIRGDKELDTLVRTTIAGGASGVLPFVRRAAHKGLTVGKIRKPEG